MCANEHLPCHTPQEAGRKLLERQDTNWIFFPSFPSPFLSALWALCKFPRESHISCLTTLAICLYLSSIAKNPDFLFVLLSCVQPILTDPQLSCRALNRPRSPLLPAVFETRHSVRYTECTDGLRRPSPFQKRREPQVQALGLGPGIRTLPRHREP